MKNLKLFLLLFPLISISQQKFNAFREELIKSKTYEYVYGYENNYAVFRTFKGKMGLIDTLGNVVIKPNYDYIYNKENLKNLFEVGKNVNKKFKRGYIDLKENIKIPFEYDNVFYFEKGLISVTKNNKTGIVDTLNKVILPLKFDNIMSQDGILFVRSNNSLDLFDASGKQLTNFKAVNIAYFTADKTIVKLQNNTTFIINNQGNIVLNAIKNHQFEKVISSDNYIIRNTITNKKGIINSLGKFEIECKYDDILPSNSVFIVKDKNKYGIVSKTDLVLKPVIYNYVYRVNYKDSIFSNQYFAEKDNLKGIINPFLENDVIPFQYKNIQVFSEFYVVENSENKNGLLSENGKTVIDEKYEFYTGFKNKIFAVKDNKNYLLSIENKNYSEIEIPIENFVKNLFSVSGISINKYQIYNNQKQFGVISTENKIVIPCEYDFIENIDNSGEFIVRKNKKYGVVNVKNQVVLELKYDSYKMMKETINFEIKNSKDKKYYFPNHSLQ